MRITPRSLRSRLRVFVDVETGAVRVGAAADAHARRVCPEHGTADLPAGWGVTVELVPEGEVAALVRRGLIAPGGARWLTLDGRRYAVQARARAMADGVARLDVALYHPSPVHGALDRWEILDAAA